MEEVKSIRMSSQKIGGQGRILTLVEVYDIAAEIGKEFETLIDEEGGTVKVAGLMQKVISALEYLEMLVEKNESELSTIEDLRKTIEHLELEQTKKSGERVKYVKDIEQLEEFYKQESRDYLSTIKRLQEENRTLSTSLAAATERDSAFSEEESYIEVDLVNKLQNIVEKQREQIRNLDLSLSDIKSELEESKLQNEKLSSSNKELRRKLRQSQSQLHCLVDERAELQVTLQDQQREVSMLAKRMGLVAKENEDLARSSTADPDLRNKVVYDLDDPNRPRFTLAELKEILQERNNLRARVSDLEDELELYRPNANRCQLQSQLTGSSFTEGCDCAYHSGLEHAELLPTMRGSESCLNRSRLYGDLLANELDENLDDSDLPVQGPMPYEPEDAPWKRNESSGIKKFFRRIFGNTESEASSMLSSGLHRQIVDWFLQPRTRNF